MKKANNIIEVVLLLAIVTVVSIAVMTILNNKKQDLVDMSKVTVKSEVTDE